MSSILDAFLKQSSAAKRVKVRPKIVIHRNQLSPDDLVSIKKTQTYPEIPKKEEVCELEIDGKVLGRGRIIKKGGEYYFKLIELV